MEELDQEFFHILSFSMFSDVKGPVPVYCYPKSVPESTQVEIAMKSVSLLMGEAIYQAGLSNDLKYFGILPFPDLNYIGLTYFFLIPDDNARGKSKAATVTIVVKDSNHHFVYNNIHTLRILLDRTRVKLRKNPELPDIHQILDTLRLDIISIFKSPRYQTIRPRKKIVISGLNNVGKTSFLQAIPQELQLDITPIEWDHEGLSDYREKFYKNAKRHLPDTNLLIFLIDTQDNDRFNEMLGFLSKTLSTLENFKNFPFIQIVFHKNDPKLNSSEDRSLKCNEIQKIIEKLHPNWNLRFCTISTFDRNSIVNCITTSLAYISPNTTIYDDSIKWFVQRINGHFAVLLMKNGIIISEIAINSDWLNLIHDLKPDILDVIANIEEENNRDFYHSLIIDSVNIIIYKFQLGPMELYYLFDSNKQKKEIERFLKKIKKKLYPLIEITFG